MRLDRAERIGLGVAISAHALLFVALSYVLVNLIVDLLYPLFDPRVVAE